MGRNDSLDQTEGSYFVVKVFVESFITRVASVFARFLFFLSFGSNDEKIAQRRRCARGERQQRYFGTTHRE